MNSSQKFVDFRKKYERIIYHKYIIIKKENLIEIEFHFEIPNLTKFCPKFSFSSDLIENKNINEDLLKTIIFNIGMIELISYYKSTCPKIIEIRAGYLDDFQKNWYKKLFYNGLGEFLYTNNIFIEKEDLFNFEINSNNKIIGSVEFKGIGNLIPVGGGKDSIVTLELLNRFKNINKTFLINKKESSLKCCEIAGYKDNDICSIKRIIDKNLIELNSKGFLNGHTPFSSIVAIYSYLIAYLTNKKNIVLSNENSANEPTVLNTNVNHQYSKSYEFEQDFYEYTKKYFKININYFSLLRPIKEIQIAKLFSNYDRYHSIFKSCNLGSKEKDWIWCCSCPKCLFVYIILSPFISQEKLINIFGKDLLNDKNLENIFLELIGNKETKPFECVGTIVEVNYALNLFIEKNNNLPYLVELYKNNYYKKGYIDLNYVNEKDNNIPKEYLDILKEGINHDTRNN